MLYIGSVLRTDDFSALLPVGAQLTENEKSTNDLVVFQDVILHDAERIGLVFCHYN